MATWKITVKDTTTYNGIDFKKIGFINVSRLDFEKK